MSAPRPPSPTAAASSPSPSDSDAENAAIAAAMGFSGFGTQAAGKKRKYKNEDAVVDVVGGGGDGAGAGGRGGAFASGGNRIAIGVGRGRGRGFGGGGGVALGAHGDVGSHGARETGGEILLDSGGREVTSVDMPQTLIAAQLPPPPPLAPETSGLSRAEVLKSLGAGTQQELNALKSGVVLPGGDVVYFSPGFVGDPWRGLGVGV